MSTTAPSLRAAVVGAGLMGRWHAHAIERLGGRVVAVIDSDVARAAALGTRLAARPGAVPDLRSALRDGGVDVVHVCTPVESHALLVEEAVEAGVHLLVEKPLAGSAAEVERLHGLAEARGVLLCPVHQFLFQPGVLAVERALPGLGVIRQVDVVACSAGADGRSDAVREAVARDILPHGLALVRRLVGRRVSEVRWTVVGTAAGEIRALGESAAATVVLSVSMRARPTENSLTLRCDLGTACANLYHGYATVERGEPSRLDKALRPLLGSASVAGAAVGNLLARSARREPAYPGLRELVRRFHLACTGREASPISVDESIDVARARDTIAAARTNVVG